MFSSENGFFLIQLDVVGSGTLDKTGHKVKVTSRLNMVQNGGGTHDGSSLSSVDCIFS